MPSLDTMKKPAAPCWGLLFRVTVRWSFSPLTPLERSHAKSSELGPPPNDDSSNASTVHGPDVFASLKRSTSTVLLPPTGIVTAGEEKPPPRSATSGSFTALLK